MEQKNEMMLTFDSRSSNESFARVAVAAFTTQLNPTLEEVADIKTAVSEAITNAIIHGYDNQVRKIRIRCQVSERTLYVQVEDDGKGIADVKKAMEPMYTTRAGSGPLRDGICIHGSVYGSGGSGVKSGRGNHRPHEKEDRTDAAAICIKGGPMERTLGLIQRAHDGDKEARDILVEENVGLVWSIVRRFQNRGVEPEDLFQIGTIGLIKAVDKFDCSYEVCFSTYAVPMITGEIKRYLRDDGILKVSRSLKETAAKAYRIREQQEKQTGREPTTQEIARELGISPEELMEAMDSYVQVESLQQTIYQGEGNTILLMDKLEEKENQSERVLNRLFLEEILGKLEGEERELIYQRYFQEKTQSVIAKEMGISQVQVSRMEKRILKKMQEEV